MSTQQPPQDEFLAAQQELAGEVQMIRYDLQEIRQLVDGLQEEAHHNRWNLRAARIEERNNYNEQRVETSRSAARLVNRTRVWDKEPLEPLCLPITRHPTVDIPLPPRAGEPPSVPPPLPDMEEIPQAHPLFPKTLGDWRALTGKTTA
ncbi:hypothetical protein DL93DRAFT_2229291 [Clavulina sp. PMI_390]|nr:hypothetical protein DL93DRAFT_2229291 [Clavulina sp. PMI_390]